MAFCGNCGNALNEGQRFCPSCGRSVGVAAPQAAQPPQQAPGPVSPPAGPSAAGLPPQAAYTTPPPPPPQYAMPPAGGAPSGYPPPPDYGQGYAPQAWGAPPRKRSRAGAWVGLGSAVVVIAIACVLVFVVFKGDIFGGGASSEPEGTVEAMFTAFENKDTDTLFGLLDPEALEQITGFMDEDAFKETLKDGLLEFDSIKFSGIEMSTESLDESSAIVTITDGTVSITQDGETETEDVTQADEPVTFDLVKRDGSWYLDPYSLDML